MGGWVRENDGVFFFIFFFIFFVRFDLGLFCFYPYFVLCTLSFLGPEKLLAFFFFAWWSHALCSFAFFLFSWEGVRVCARVVRVCVCLVVYFVFACRA